MSWTVWLSLAGGLVALVAGAEFLVRGASHLAARLGISPLVIGLTVVAFGTSAPEMAVSAISAWKDQPDLAVGNVVGSNIFNVLAILGLSAVVAPLAVAARLVRLDVPIMVGVSLLLWVMALDGVIRFWEAALLFLGIVSYTTFQVRFGRGEEDPAVKKEFAGEYAEPAFAKHSWLVDAGAVLGGLALLVGGSHFLVEAAVDVARALGVSELVIGLTIVAAGTSLPELATSVLASIRGERDIAIGNIIGSNLFNILAVLGMAGLMRRDGLPVSPQVLALDLPVMVAVAIACMPLFLDLNIGRGKGLFFLAAYAVYAVYLVLTATGSSALPGFREAMLAYVLPLTGITLLSIAIQSARNRRPG